jgi:hypothetical protein
VLPRDKASVAGALGVEPFKVNVSRQSNGESLDVTAQLRAALTDRVPELLAIMVHRGAGGTTLDPTSDAFGQRARRLQALQVRQVDNLVLEAEVVGLSGGKETIGADSHDETYLDTATPGHPVLYHDFDGRDWTSRIRSRLAEPLAVLTETPALTDTFRLLLTSDEADREELLRGWGISTADVGALRVQLGAVTESEKSQHQRWFAAILSVARGGHGVLPGDVPLEVPELEERLEAAGLSHVLAQSVARAGAWPEVRGATTRESVLPLLSAAGVALRELSEALERLGEPRLRIGIAHQRFRSWRGAHLPWIVAALGTRGIEDARAKDLADQVQVAADCEFELDPPMHELLVPFCQLLEQVGVTVSPHDLADDPQLALANSAGLPQADLGDRARLLYDEEARAARLRMLADRWRAELIHIGLLATAAGQTRSTIRSQAEGLDKRISRVERPSQLSNSLSVVLPGAYEELAKALRVQLRDDLPGIPPTRRDLLNMAEQCGLHTSESASITAALEAPRRQRVETLTRQASQLREARLKPRFPPGLAPRDAVVKPTSPRAAPKSVAAVKVHPASDRRKRELGDDGESWATASMVAELSDLAPKRRADAIDAIIAFLVTHFDGSPVNTARAHGESAKDPSLDDEDLIDHLEQFLHVAQHSDAFGFDLLGWIPGDDGAGGRPMAIEVKSSSDTRFMLSAAEWRCAERLSASEGEPALYAVLVVRRTGTNQPTAMDFLEDPYQLSADNRITLDTDTYQVGYTFAV